jgi:hypothetical protein
MIIRFPPKAFTAPVSIFGTSKSGVNRGDFHGKGRLPNPKLLAMSNAARL